MYSLPKNVYRERIDFSKIKTTVPIPNLIEIQKILGCHTHVHGYSTKAAVLIGEPPGSEE